MGHMNKKKNMRALKKTSGNIDACVIILQKKKDKIH